MRLVLLLAALVAFAIAQTGPCIWTDPVTKHTWDLTPANAAKDYATPQNANNEYFYFQPCIATTTCAAAPSPGPWKSPVCQKDGVGLWHSCGALNTGVATFNNSKLTIAYSGGDNGRLALVNYICTTGAIVLPVGEPGGKLYVVNFKSKVGCYKGQGGGGGGGGDEFDAGWVFVIIVLCGLFVYFVAGFLFLKFARGAEGVEAIPQGEFWMSLPGLVKDGSMFIVGKVTGGGSTAGYQQVK